MKQDFDVNKYLQMLQKRGVNEHTLLALILDLKIEPTNSNAFPSPFDMTLVSLSNRQFACRALKLMLGYAIPSSLQFTVVRQPEEYDEVLMLVDEINEVSKYNHQIKTKRRKNCEQEITNYLLKPKRYIIVK